MSYNTSVMLRQLKLTQHRQTIKAKRQNPTKFKMKPCSLNFTTAIIILVLLPYSSTLSLPSGDPAPGRSPGPPELEPFDADVKVQNADTNIEAPTEEVTNVEGPEETYDETTTSEDIEMTTVSEVVSETTVSDACAFARIPSDSDNIVTLSDEESEVNLTVSHPVFETDELIRGVVYDGKCSL